MVRSRPRRARALGALAATAALTSALSLATGASPAAALDGTLSGTAFRDYSADGRRDALEPGEPGVGVTVYDATGASVGTATTAADGTYTVTVAGAASADLRVEFALPGSRPHLQIAPMGDDSDGAIAFATVDAAGVDVGVHDPSEYCQANPTVVTGCLGYGHAQGSVAARDTLKSFPYDASGAAFTNTATATAAGLATFGDVGATFALEHDRTRDAVYAAAFQKQYSGFGPGGPGAVYRVSGGVTTVLATIPNAGTDARAAAPVNAGVGASLGDGWVTDGSWADVGTLSLGDMALTPDDATLWVVNLYDRSLYPVDPATGAVATPVAVPLATGAAQACAAADVRPFALARHDGLLYLGETCSAHSTQQASDLRFYVYAFDPVARTFGAAPVFEAAVDAVNHGAPGNGCNGGTGAWHPWAATDRFLAGQCAYPQPWLTSLAFDRGNLVLGVRDRFGDQSAADFPLPGPGVREGVLAGDLLRACGSPAAGWTLESNGSCGGVTSAGAGNGQGPGGGEFYFQDRFSNGTNHQETSNGGVLVVPGRNEVLHTVMDPDLVSGSNWRAGGVHWERNDTGANDHWFQLYDKCDTSGLNCPPGRGETGMFGKASGLTDLVALCDKAPVEIGNRVWFDADADGAQDPGEPPLAGVTVRLLAADGVTELASVTTDAGGLYAFSSDPYRTDATGRAYGVAALAPGAQVRVAAPTGTTGPSGPAALTAAGAGAAGTDSDVDRTTGLSAVLTIAGPGRNRHDLDIGYAPAAAPPPTPPTPPTPGGTVIGTVYVDADRDGVQDPGEAPLAGVTVQLVDPSGVVVATTTSGPDGGFRFDGVPPGSYVVRQLQPDRYGSTTANEVPVTVVAGAEAPAPFGEVLLALPRTGRGSGRLAAVGALCVLLGLGLVRSSRRPRRRPA